MTTASIDWQGAPLARSTVLMRYLTVVAWIAILIGIVLRLTQLPTRVLFLDEAFTQIRVAGHTSYDMLRAFDDGRAVQARHIRAFADVDATSTPERLVTSLEAEDAQHPPLFYLIEFAFVKLFGNSLAAWRILPVICGILAVPAAFALARELFGDRQSALLAAALFAVSPIERIYSDQAREYSLFVLLVLLATTALLRAARSRRVGNLASYALFTTAGLYTDPFMLYVVAAHAVYVAATSWPPRRGIAKAAAFCAACVVSLTAYAPWMNQMFIHRNDIAETNVWSATHWPVVRLAAKWAFNFGTTFFDLEYIDLRWALCLAVVALVAIIAIIRGFVAADIPARWCIAATIVVPIVLLVTPDLVLGEHRSSVARYALPVFAMLTIVTARGLTGKPARATVVLAAGLCACFVGSLHLSWWDNDSNADDARIAAMISSVPHAQVVSTLPPISFLGYARLLPDDARVSLTSDPSRVDVAPADPIFIVRPTADDLVSIERHTGLHFEAVPFSPTITAHDIGTALGSDAGATAPKQLYRSALERSR